MEQLFAPWRIKWVERTEPDTEDCPFCALPDADDDRENRVVAENESAYVLLNNAPYNPGHAMVIPRRHAGEYRGLDDAELLAYARLTQRTLDALESAFAPDAFNTGCNLGGGAAGGSIDDHLHRHVVPRWEGDSNFMPVIGDTQVIVEAIADSYDRLHDAFAAQDGTETTDADTAVVVE